MGTFNLTLTFPDPQQARIVAAMRTYYTTFGAGGVPVVPTAAEALEAFRQNAVAAIRDIVLKVERDAARAAADGGVTPPTVT